jgi:hypothetical protein
MVPGGSREARGASRALVGREFYSGTELVWIRWKLRRVHAVLVEIRRTPYSDGFCRTIVSRTCA